MKFAGFNEGTEASGNFIGAPEVSWIAVAVVVVNAKVFSGSGWPVYVWLAQSMWSHGKPIIPDMSATFSKFALTRSVALPGGAFVEGRPPVATQLISVMGCDADRSAFVSNDPPPLQEMLPVCPSVSSFKHKQVLSAVTSTEMVTSSCRLSGAIPEASGAPITRVSGPEEMRSAALPPVKPVLKRPLALIVAELLWPSPGSMLKTRVRLAPVAVGVAGVPVIVGVPVPMGVRVTVGVHVAVGLRVMVGVQVPVPVAVPVLVTVPVAVAVGVADGCTPTSRQIFRSLS